MDNDSKHCGSCFFWGRIAHPLDFEIGRCGLFEREMSEQGHCGMWESKLSNAIEEMSPIVETSETT